MTIKQLQRIVAHAGLIAVASSAISSYAHAQEATEEHKKDSNDLKIKISLSARAAGDFSPNKANSDFMPASIPTKENGGRQRFIFSTGKLNLGIEKTIPFASKTIRCALDSGLDGKKGVKLKRVYVDHPNFLVGLYFTNLSDTLAAPKTLTSDAPCSFVGESVAQVTWKDQLAPGFSYAVGIEQAPKLELFPGNEETQDYMPNKNFPALGTSVKYEEAFGHVRLGGLLRVTDYYRTIDKKDDYLYPWGVNLTSVIKAIPEMTTLKLHFIYGMGIGSYIADFGGVGERERKDIYFTSPSKIALINTWGGYIGVEHCWLPELRSTVAYGFLDTTDTQQRDKTDYKQGHYSSANLTYHPTEQVTVGVEYQFGRRASIDQKDIRNTHRAQAAVAFKI
ncbi:MAG: hypothetical protein ROO73_06255 [Roseivirga sp.]